MPDESTEARRLAGRLTLHHAVQLLPSFAQARIPPRQDDSHRSMMWDHDARAFRSERDEHGLVARLVVPSLAAELWKDEKRLASVNLNGRRPLEALAWLQEALDGAPDGGEVKVAWPEYDLPPRPGAPDAPLDADADALAELARWYDDAARFLGDLFGETPEASPVRCWPHHFDLATLQTYPAEGESGDARYVGVGFSPGDGPIPDPYYYVNGWPPPTPSSLPRLAPPGAWHTEGWVGALLGADEIVSEQEKTVKTFLAQAVRAMRATVLADR